jgi:hypothetical protein
MLEPGEAVIDKHKTNRYAWLFKLMGVKGFAGGGLVDRMSNGPSNYMGGIEAGFGRAGENLFAAAALADLKANVHNEAQRIAAQMAATAAAGLNNLPLGTGPHSGSAAIAQAFARSILFAYGWTQAQWPYEQALWNQESGWNAYAANPTSNARGIPQNINGWSAYAPGDYQAQIRWGDAYIFARYGTPANAWAHEKAYNWYDTGGWIKPGMNHMYNGTGKMEHLTNDTNSSGGTLQVAPGGASAFEQFMVMAIREWVVRKGGGSVQKAFGIPGK